MRILKDAAAAVLSAATLLAGSCALGLGLLGLAPLIAQAADGCPDDFAGPALAKPWTFVDADGADGGSAQVTGGKLQLTGKGHDAYGDINQFVGIKRGDVSGSVPGDFDVSVKIESQTNTNGWAQAGIAAANDVTDLSKGGYVIVDVTPAHAYNVFYDDSGKVGALDKHQGKGVSGYPVWIRLAKSGTKYSAYYKNSVAAAWSPILENFTTQGAGSASQIALVSLSHNDTLACTTVMDDFECLNGTTVSLRDRGEARGARAGIDAGTDAEAGEADVTGRLRWGRYQPHGWLWSAPVRR